MTVFGVLEPRCLWAVLTPSPDSKQHWAATDQPHSKIAAVGSSDLTGCLHLLISLVPKWKKKKNHLILKLYVLFNSSMGTIQWKKKTPMLLPYAWSINHVILILLATINKQVLKLDCKIMSVFHYFFFLGTLTIYTKWKLLQIPGIFYQLFLQVCVKSCVFTNAYNVFSLF